jgi:hypothetical protein
MLLWLSLALGLNLRDDRPCGRLREAGGLGTAVVLACVWAALAGTFYGAIIPFWRSEAELRAGDSLMAVRPPRFEEARESYRRAIEADHYNVPALAGPGGPRIPLLAVPRGGQSQGALLGAVLLAHDGALDGKWRDPDNLEARRRQAAYARRSWRRCRPTRRRRSCSSSGARSSRPRAGPPPSIPPARESGRTWPGRAPTWGCIRTRSARPGRRCGSTP